MAGGLGCVAGTGVAGRLAFAAGGVGVLVVTGGAGWLVAAAGGRLSTVTVEGMVGWPSAVGEAGLVGASASGLPSPQW